MSASIHRFPLWRCPGCGHYLREPEVAHNRRCKKAMALAVARTMQAPKSKREPKPSQKTRRRAALRRKLAEHPVLFPIVVKAREKIHPDQLQRVANGKSDFGPSTWKRLAPYLGEAGQ
jgi:hypothetical protein